MDNAYDFSDLKATFINCTLKRSPDLSHTEGLVDVSAAIMMKHGVTVEVVRAVDHLLGLGAADVEEAVRSRAATLRAGLATVAGVALHDHGDDLSGIVSFTVDGRTPEAVRHRLLDARVTVSVSSVGSTRLDMEARGLEAVIRMSPHYFNSDQDLERAVDAVAHVTGS